MDGKEVGSKTGRVFPRLEAMETLVRKGDRIYLIKQENLWPVKPWTQQTMKMNS
jgi:hypothetical protein